MKPEVADDTHVVQSQGMSEAELGGCLTTRRGGKLCVPCGRRDVLMPVDTPAALAPLCGTLWRASAGTASHTS